MSSVCTQQNINWQFRHKFKWNSTCIPLYLRMTTICPAVFLIWWSKEIRQECEWYCLEVRNGFPLSEETTEVRVDMPTSLGNAWRKGVIFQLHFCEKRQVTLPVWQSSAPSLYSWDPDHMLENNLSFKEAPKEGKYLSKCPVTAAHTNVIFKMITLCAWLWRWKNLMSDYTEATLDLCVPNTIRKHKHVHESVPDTVTKTYLKDASHAKLLTSSIWTSCQACPFIFPTACGLLIFISEGMAWTEDLCR